MHAILQESTQQAPLPAAAKGIVKSRYFIELHVAEKPGTTRVEMDEVRRHKAQEFIQVMGEWLNDHGLRAEVRSLSATALGQVMIVCTRQVIDLIREQDIWAIAHIRCSDQMTDLKRISGKI